MSELIKNKSHPGLVCLKCMIIYLAHTVSENNISKGLITLVKRKEYIQMIASVISVTREKIGCPKLIPLKFHTVFSRIYNLKMIAVAVLAEPYIRVVYRQSEIRVKENME